MQVVAALALEVAAHLAQRADHFMPAVLRCQWPATTGVRQRCIGSGPDQRRCRQITRWQRAQTVQAIAGGIGDQHTAVGIHRQTAGPGQARQAAVAHQCDLVALRCYLHDAAIKVTHVEHAVVRGGQRQRPIDHAAIAQQRADRAIGTDATHRVVEQVGHQQRAMGIEGQRHRRIEARRDAQAIGQPRALAAGQGTHVAVGADHPDAVVEGVGHIDLALRVHRDAHRCIEARLRGRPIGVTLLATGQRDHLAIGADTAERVVAGVGYVQVALRIGGDARGRIETGLQCRAVDAPLALPGHGLDAAIRQAAADAVVVAGIGEVDAAIGTAQQRIGIGEAGLRRRTIAVTGMTIAGQHLDLCGPGQRRGRRACRFSQGLQR